MTQNLLRFDPLPIPRKRLFALLVLPPMLFLVLGYTGGRLARRSQVTRVSQVEYRVDGSYHWVQPPPGYLEVARRDALPTLVSPWGESHEVWSAPVFSRSAIRVYSPFSSSEETSADFEALLTARALRAVHGLEISPEEVRRRYFETEGDRIVGLAAGGLALERDFPGFERARSGPEAPLVLGTALVLYLLVIALFFAAFRARFGDRRRLAVYWGFLGAILVLLFTQMGMAVAGWFRPDAARALIEIGIRRLGSLPLGSALAWSVSAILVAAAYRLALAHFERIELPARPTRFTLIDLSRDTDPAD